MIISRGRRIPRILPKVVWRTHSLRVTQKAGCLNYAESSTIKKARILLRPAAFSFYAKREDFVARASRDKNIYVDVKESRASLPEKKLKK